MKQEAIATDPVQLLQGWSLEINADMVLRGQGADAEKIRVRNPRVVAVAVKALREGMAWIDPRVVYRRMAIHSVWQDRVLLEAGGELTGRTLAQHLASTEQVLVVVATIGERLEARIAEAVKSDLPLGLALDGFGTAAIEALAVAVCRRFGELAAREEMRSTIPLSPGMTGWRVEAGQRQIFRLLDAERAGVQLTSNCLMTPRKSLSMVMGLGKEVREGGRICDVCSMRETCRYKKHRPMPALSLRESRENSAVTSTIPPH